MRLTVACLLLLCLHAYSEAAETTLQQPLTDFDKIANTPGLEKDTSHLKVGKASGKWARMDKTTSIAFKDFPRDWSKFNRLEFWLYSEKSVNTAFMIIAASENPKSEGPDYYGFRVPLDFTGWKHFELPVNPRGGTRSPLGLQSITGLSFTATGFNNKPHPEEVLYMSDLKLTKVLGPLTTDEEFFAALDLARPGLEAVRAAVEQKNYKETKTQLLAYMRSRTKPVWHFDWRDRPEPIPPPPPGAQSSDGMDYFSQTITVDWKGWKHFCLGKASFGASRKPVGWNYVTAITFNASGWEHTPDPVLVLNFDDMRLAGKRAAVIGDFSTDRTTARWSGVKRDETVRKVGQASARWADMNINVRFSSSQIPHDWSDFDALEFWCHSNAASGAKLQLVLSSDAKSVSSKDPDIMRHVFRGFDAEMFLGKRIDWEANPVPPDAPNFTKEWTFSLNRFPFWGQLADLYWARGDEKYAREWVAQLRSWVEDEIVPYDAGPGSTLCWRTIECGIRMAGSWPNAYYKFLGSPSFDPEANALFLKSVREHALRLALIQQKYPDRSGNWITMECNGLLHCAILFPEFREAPEWLRIASDRLNSELTRQVYPDGAQMELTSGYHQVCVHNFSAASDFARLNNVSLPGDYMKNLEKLYGYDLLAMMPNRTLAPLNDAGVTDVRGWLARGATLFSRPDFEWAGSDGAKGIAPKVGSYAFPYAGHFIMRTGWNPDDKFLIFDGGPYGIGHQHEDKLTLFMRAFGRILVTEPGNYKYDRSKWRRYVLSTFAHNTIVVDGLEQHRKAVKETWKTESPLIGGPNAPCRWFTSDAMDVARSTYDSGYGPSNDKSVSHERTVVFVKPDYWIVVDRLLGKGKHSFESLYHLDSDNATADPATKSVRTENDDANVLLIPAGSAPLDVKVAIGQEDPVQGWLPAAHRKIPCVIYRCESECPTVMATVIYPYKGKKAPQVKLTPVSLASEGQALTVSFPDHANRADTIIIGSTFYTGERRETRCGDFATDAEIVLIRDDPKGRGMLLVIGRVTFLKKNGADLLPFRTM